MALSEQIELLGKGLYGGDIPDVITLQAIPTVSELEFISSEDFDQTMIDKILPQAIKEKIDTNKLLECDYNWILRCLRILNYGPYFTTNSIFCADCGKVHYGEFQVDLTAVACKPIPEDFDGHIKISRDEFLDFNGDIELRMPSMSTMLQAFKDKAFQLPSGKQNRELARLCYTITSIKGKSGMTPIETKIVISKEMSSADYMILKDRVSELTDFGLRAGGSCRCPKCGGNGASFIAMTDDRYFRPTMGDLRQWKKHRSERPTAELLRYKEANV